MNSRGEDCFWMPDVVMEMFSADASEPQVFDDGCDKVAEGVMWDLFSGSYRGIPEPKILQYATHIRLPAYDAAVW